MQMRNDKKGVDRPEVSKSVTVRGGNWLELKIEAQNTAYSVNVIYTTIQGLKRFVVWIYVCM